MKNQIFNIKRFALYANYNIRMFGKTYLLQLLGMGLGIFFLTLFNMFTERNWNGKDWHMVTLLSGIFYILILVGLSFPQLRKKDNVMQFLLLPASIFEKYSYEFLLRFVVFVLLFPIILILFSHLAYTVFEYVRSLSDQGIFNYKTIFEENMFNSSGLKVNDAIALLSTAFFVLTIVFAGTLVFMKYALIKTAAFVMSVIGLGVFYFYLLFEKIKIGKPFFTDYFTDKDMALVVLDSLLAIGSIWVLIYAFFKLKEKVT